MKTFFRLLTPIIFITISLSSKEIYLDSSFDPNIRVDDLMEKMTLEEKIAQMCQYVGLNYLSMASADMSEEEILNSDSEAKY